MQSSSSLQRCHLQRTDHAAAAAAAAHLKLQQLYDHSERDLPG